MIGLASPKQRPGRPEPGNHRRPKRCTDKACPSRARCKRPEFDGEDGRFHRNRAGGEFCGYLISKEG